MAESWSSVKAYNKWDFVEYNDKTFYSFVPNNSATPSFVGLESLDEITNPVWVDEDHFLWSASYTTDSTLDSNTNTIELGDGYQKDSAAGPTNTPLKLNFFFENIGDAEAAAILNFLNEKGGEVFIANLPAPYNRYCYFSSTTWNHSQVFKDNNSVSIELVEVFYTPKPPYTTVTVTNDCSKCNFNLNYIKQYHIAPFYANQMPNYDPDDGTFGDELYILSAYNTTIGAVEDFVVKCESIDLGPADIPDYDPIANSTSTYKIVPLNVGGMIIKFLKIALGATTAPSSVSTKRNYSLDGATVNLWTEVHGDYTTVSKTYAANDAIVTPQYFPIVQTLNGDTARNWEQVTGFRSAGFPMSYYVASLLYWAIEDFNVDVKFLFTPVTTGKTTVIINKITNLKIHQQFSTDDLTYKNYLVPNTISATWDETIANMVTLGLFTTGVLQKTAKRTLNSQVQIWPEIFITGNYIEWNIIPGSYANPSGTDWNFYGPSAVKIGYSIIDIPQFDGLYKLDGSESLLDTGNLSLTHPTISLWRTYYLHHNSLDGAEIQFKIGSLINKNMPAWIGNIRCVNDLLAHYPRAIRLSLFGSLSNG